MTATLNTAAESKALHVAAMGDELGTLYDALWQETAWVHCKWEEYVTLYGSKPSRVELLNKAAPAFFRIIQDVLWEDITLHIARLTDYPQSAGKKNLSVRQLPAAIGDAATRVAVEAAIAKAIANTEFCRDWRNRHIAHRDLRLTLDQASEPLQTASRERIRAALTSLAEALNAVAAHYLNTTTGFESGTEAGGAMCLLSVLHDGVGASQARFERLVAGAPAPGDLGSRDL